MFNLPKNLTLKEDKMIRSFLPFLSFIFILFLQTSHAQYYFNRAFSLPGTAGNYVVTDPGANLSITGDFTVECWVKQMVNTGAQIVVQKRLGSSATGYTVYLSTGRIAIRTNSTTRLTAATTLPVGVWSHIAATYNATTGVFVAYLNGVQDGTVTVSGAAPAPDTDSLRIGAGFNSPFNGSVDDIRVWNVERTATQIRSAMRMPLGETGVQYPGLVASWRANDIAGGSGVEEINGYTAYMRGTATYELLGDKPGYPWAFNTGVIMNGTSGTYIAAPSISQLNITGSFTLECWVNPVNALSPSFQNVIAKRLSGANGYELYLNAGRVTVRTNGTTRLSGTTVLANNRWAHVAVTYDASTTTFKTYTNGVNDGTATASGTPVTNGDSLYFGRGINSPFNGMLDEVRICNYAKSLEEIQKGMYVSIDENNEPMPTSNTNITYSLEGTLKGTDGSSRGTFRGAPESIRFTQVIDSAAHFPTPLDRWDAGFFGPGFRFKYSNLTFGASPTTIIDSIYMPQNLTISDINVFVGILHTYANDISLSLINPAGSTTRILYPGAATDNGRNMITIFDDQADSTAGATLRAPWSPRVKPANNLAPFNGQSSLGWWKLSITDIFPGADDGILHGWAIQFNNQQITAIKSGYTELPLRYELSQNYPNPFNPVTTIKYSIAENQHVKISVFDILGREVGTLVNEMKKAGNYSLTLDASGLASGVYFYTIKAGSFTDTKKMIVVK
jgi:subtilisin-like proprotein convertase family protein